METKNLLRNRIIKMGAKDRMARKIAVIPLHL